MVTNKDCDYLFYVGINDIEKKDDIVSISPNPSSGFLSIRVLRQDYKIMNIQLSDTQGRGIVMSNLNEIDVSYLTEGMYILQVNFDNGNRIFKTFIKN